MGTEKTFGKRSFEISSTDKIYFPEENYTKGDILDYYEKIAQVMLPHIKDRLVTMIRFPNGIKGKRFFQKDAPDYFPDWIETKAIKNQDGSTTNYVICNDQATLVYLANQSCITPHIWLSRKDKPDNPDKLIVDLDPEKENFSQVKMAAGKVRQLFEKELELPVFLMTTGSRGLHVVVPLKRTRNFDEVREFAQNAAKHLENENPDIFTTAARKNKREDKIYLDVGRNAFGQTGVAPYAVRPIDGAPVATPLDWDELEKNTISAQSFNIKNIFDRLDSRSDPWKEITTKAVTLTSAEKKLADLLENK